MSEAAIVTMVVAMLALWGGLAASLAVVLRRTRRSSDR
ncbi:MAG: methionine/alanine import family NSS transporter small subunit [Nitriliruptoraceae bacterium]